MTGPSGPTGASGPTGPSRPLEWDVKGGPTIQQLVLLARTIGATTPWWGEEQETLLDMAQLQVEAYLGQRFTPESFEALTPDQQQALATAIVYQAVWLADLEQEVVGPSDIQSLPGEGITFSSRERPRLSPAVPEIVALRGLIVRSGMARQPEPAP
jgi:hypothetical protein